MTDLAGRRALVTGASGGLGRALAIRLARAGVSCVLLARREDELAETADYVVQAGVSAAPIVGDVRRQLVRGMALEAARTQFGGLDLLVNNAGVSAHGRFHESGPERLRRILEVNVLAAAELTREATPLLASPRGGPQRPGEPNGVVANIGSILGWRGVPHNAEYCASKFALRGWSEAIRPELAPLGVHVLHASPGTIDTDFFEHLVDRRGDLPWGKRHGYPPELVADRVVRGIARRKNEVAIAWSDWAFVRATRLAPWLLDRIMTRYG